MGIVHRKEYLEHHGRTLMPPRSPYGPWMAYASLLLLRFKLALLLFGILTRAPFSFTSKTSHAHYSSSLQNLQPVADQRALAAAPRAELLCTFLRFSPATSAVLFLAQAVAYAGGRTLLRKQLGGQQLLIHLRQRNDELAPTEAQHANAQLNAVSARQAWPTRS
eukprot:6183523-Pleurochrysis_carterae.AAC.2